MRMDRIEQTGLATAVLIHGLLALAIWFAMQNAPKEAVKPQPSINVSLVGEIAPVSSAPDAIQEEPAPSSLADAPARLSDPAPEAPTVTPTPVPQVTPTPVRKITPTPPKTPPKTVPVQKTAPPKTTPKATPKATPKSTPKAAAKTSPPKTATKKSGGFGKGFEQTIAGIGGSSSSSASAASGAGKASGTPAAKSGAEVRQSVTAALGSQIKPFLNKCVPNSPEINRLIFPVTVSLDSSGRATGTNIGSPSGVTDTNRPQVSPVKDCISKAINAASPFRGLDPDYHDVWKSHSMRIKPS
ncbi:hypothetical protein ACFOWX_12945 [Sphingorhabdus arenilitoris]|uniref:Cell envelope biogenesis protein TolA n=1 Tax=Sphingorhabdus arenilitoris TaxID=1490041 RepID=A0ABV8RKW9_9SPHN